MDKGRVSYYLNSLAQSYQQEKPPDEFFSKIKSHPKSSSCSNISASQNTSSIRYNPFSVEPSSFSMPSFSPSVFSSSLSQDIEEDSNQSFSWNIDQVALFNPAQIDESSIQHDLNDLDEHQEEEVQQAIQSYFLQNNIAPSPWNGSVKHVTFSPHLPSTKYFNISNNSSSTSLETKVNVKEVWTQTTLSLPPQVDLEKILGQFSTFHDDQQCQNFDITIECENLEEPDLLSTSSLRRKLFSPNRNSGSLDGNMNFKTPERKGKTSFCSGQLFSSSPISLRAFSISPCNSIKPLNNTLISPIKRSTIITREGNKFCTPEKNEPITYLKSILKSSPACVIDYFMKETCSLTEEKLDRTTRLSTVDTSEMNISMKTEPDTSVVERGNPGDSFKLVLEASNCNPNLEENNFVLPMTRIKEFKTDLEEQQMIFIQSLDTGYQTGSHPLGSSMDFSVLSNSKRDNCSHLASTSYSNIVDSNTVPMDFGVSQQLYSIHENNEIEVGQETSLLMSQSNWKPNICSTPQKG